MYFTSNDKESIESIKKAYRKLAFELHPDKGGNEESFKQMIAEYENALRLLLQGHKEAQKQFDLDETLRNKINEIIQCEGLVIEVVGNWIWVTGQTYFNRATLKESGFKFASKKQAWYWHEGEYQAKGTSQSLDEIKAKYGTQKVKGENENRLN